MGQAPGAARAEEKPQYAFSLRPGVGLTERCAWAGTTGAAAVPTTALANVLLPGQRVMRMQEGQDRSGDQSPEYIGPGHRSGRGTAATSPVREAPHQGADPPEPGTWVVPRAPEARPGRRSGRRGPARRGQPARPAWAPGAGPGAGAGTAPARLRPAGLPGQPGYGQPAGYGQPGYGQPGYGQPSRDTARRIRPARHGQPGSPLARPSRAPSRSGAARATASKARARPPPGPRTASRARRHLAAHPAELPGGTPPPGSGHHRRRLRQPPGQPPSRSPLGRGAGVRAGGGARRRGRRRHRVRAARQPSQLPGPWPRRTPASRTRTPPAGGTSTTRLNVQAVANKVEPGMVDITSQLKYRTRCPRAPGWC